MSAETTTAQQPSSPATPQEPKSGQASQSAAQAKIGELYGPQVNPCFTATAEGDNWLDQVHGFVQDQICVPAVWFDHFFDSDHVLLDLRPGLFVTLRNSARWAEGQGITYIHDFRYEWRLPQWQRYLKKWKLYAESRSTTDKYTIQPGQPVDPGFDPDSGVRQANVGVRADFFTRTRALFSFDSGVKINIHPDVHIRMRYQYAEPFGEVYTVRFTEIAMWQYIERFTNTAEIDLERKITTFTLLRWANYATYTEGTAGVTWNTGISLLTQLTPKSAISLDASMWGKSHPYWFVQNYRIGSLYRRNFYRHWLFFELAPEIDWPQDASGHRYSTWAFAATLEIQFGK